LPIYEYVCDECSLKFDRLQPSGTRYAECPECGIPSRKALSLFAAVITGDDGEMSSVAGMGGCSGCAGGTCACSSIH
jgi:putative FmdB family regulatory protein